ncbi:helicase-related protein, partial [Klebsiella pneumoniae]|uniref:helicase-related protein n=1 Tax=Klebsiella pneumoniae TaxID=573 RepID=UPI002230165A
INFDLPFSAEDYVHRIGRTGRAGASGDALSLFAPGDERLLADIEKLIKRNLPREQLADFDPTGEQARDRERRERDEKRARSEVRRSREREDRNGTRVLDHTIVRPAFRPSDDPFFNRPYESSVPAESAEAAKPAQAAGHPRTA